jgi:hypothetical protein
MAFFNDLDALVWVATLVAIVVCCSVTFVNFQDWWSHRRIEIFDGRATLITFFAGAFLVGAFNSYSPNANAPRRTVEGIARFVGEASGKGGYNKYICATSCESTGGYALDLHDEAARVTHIGSSYAFTYLERPVGNAFVGISLRVIAVSEPDSGQVLYKMDLTNHPYRIAAYLLDTALVVGSGLLGVLLNRSLHRGKSERASNEEDAEENEEEPKGSEPVSLGLDSRDAR